MKKLFLDINFSKIYIVVMSLVCLLILGGYFSYAMFTVSKEKSNAISIVTGNLSYELLVDGEESNSLVINANSSKTFTITLNNPNNREARFNFYYKDDLPDLVVAGYIDDSNTNTLPSEVGVNLEKDGSAGSSNVYKITVVNDSVNEVTIDLGVSVGLDYNDLSLLDNQHLFNEFDGVPLANALLGDAFEDNNYYDDGTDTFITGEDPINYVWYSGKLWRAVLINNDNRTVKLITQWSMSSISYNSNNNSVYDGSYVEIWLNDTSVDGFLGNLRDPESFIVMDYEWNATMMSDSSKPNTTTMIENPVGLITIYEYAMSYNATTYNNGYLNNGQYYWTMTPYNSTRTWNINADGNLNQGTVTYVDAIRPVINLKSNIKISRGTGSYDDPYILVGDDDTNLEGTYLNTRYSGEYVRFGTGVNTLYRIVSHENGTGTKITSAEPLKSGTSFVTSSFGTGNVFSTSSTIGSFLNNTYLTSYVGSPYTSMIDTSTWYLGSINLGSDYRLAKYTNTSMINTVSSTASSRVGLLRYGELMSGQFNDVDSNTNYWLITPSSTTYDFFIGTQSGGSYASSTASYGVKPALNLNENVIITGGTGTINDPFTIELSN